MPDRERLPEDFPGRVALEAAGIATFDELVAVEDVTELPGIGKVTAERIAAALAARSPSPVGSSAGQSRPAAPERARSCPTCGGPLAIYDGTNPVKVGTGFCEKCGQRVKVAIS